MISLRTSRFLFLVGLPLAIGLHVATSRSGLPLLRGAGLGIIVVWLLYFLYLALAPCPQCGAAFFGRWLRNWQAPVGVFTRRPRCEGCGHSLAG